MRTADQHSAFRAEKYISINSRTQNSEISLSPWHSAIRTVYHADRFLHFTSNAFAVNSGNGGNRSCAYAMGRQSNTFGVRRNSLPQFAKPSPPIHRKYPGPSIYTYFSHLVSLLAELKKFLRISVEIYV